MHNVNRSWHDVPSPWKPMTPRSGSVKALSSRTPLSPASDKPRAVTNVHMDTYCLHHRPHNTSCNITQQKPGWPTDRPPAANRGVRIRRSESPNPTINRFIHTQAITHRARERQCKNLPTDNSWVAAPCRTAYTTRRQHRQWHSRRRLQDGRKKGK